MSLNYPRHHFRALIEVLPLGPETRSSDPFNGIRWNVVFKEDWDKMGKKAMQRMIWPLFRDDDDTPIAEDIPISGTHTATMHIMFPEMVNEHIEKVKVGGEFYCMEGARIVARGHITSVGSA